MGNGIGCWGKYVASLEGCITEVKGVWYGVTVRRGVRELQAWVVNETATNDMACGGGIMPRSVA